MKIIQIQDGISINADHIDGIKEVDGGCEVYVGSRVYISTYPYETLIQLLKSESMVDNGYTKNETIAKTMEKVDKVLNKSQYFAG